MRRILLPGDCRETLHQIPDASVETLVTDPPFGIRGDFGFNKTGRGRKQRGRRLQFDWDVPGIETVVVEGLTLAFRKLTRRAAALVFTGSDRHNLYMDIARENGFTVKPFSLVKMNPPPSGWGNWWSSGFELGYYAYRRSPYFGDIDPKRCNVFYSDSLRAGNKEKLPHPTQKPLALMLKFVASLVPPGGTVLDCFAGSGTTLEAAEKLRRGWIGAEINPDYCALIRKRLGLPEEPRPAAE